MMRLTQEVKLQIEIAKATDLPSAVYGELRSTLFAGDLRAGIHHPFAKGNDNVNQSTIQMNRNSSLVSGFDSSTENQVDFKRLRDIFFVAPFLVKINAKINSGRF
jgi:hypothetical protein